MTIWVILKQWYTFLVSGGECCCDAVVIDIVVAVVIDVVNYRCLVEIKLVPVTFGGKCCVDVAVVINVVVAVVAVAPTRSLRSHSVCVSVCPSVILLNS